VRHGQATKEPVEGRVSEAIRALHRDLVVIDALQYSNWDREVLEELRTGGLTCVHVTCAIWEDGRAALDNVAAWYRRLREHEDLLTPVRSGEDIEAAKAAGRVGIVLGFQNASPFEDDLGLVEVFHRLGIRVVQLTYNNQSLVGGGCYEPQDSGLSRFGRQVIREMNRLGMLVDLSHVGERTCLNAIEASRRPVAITHANPATFHPHARNKSDAVLRALAERQGVLGCTPYPHLTGGEDLTLQTWTEMVARAVDLMGVEAVGIGSDSSRNWNDETLRWIRMGRWTHEPDFGAGRPGQTGWSPWPAWFRTPADFPRLTAGLSERGFGRDEVAAIMGGNWLRVFRDSFRPATG
jgi:microsomal dipeptidase-like Zn-dependent dipeptidase